MRKWTAHLMHHGLKDTVSQNGLLGSMNVKHFDMICNDYGARNFRQTLRACPCQKKTKKKRAELKPRSRGGVPRIHNRARHWAICSDENTKLELTNGRSLPGSKAHEAQVSARATCTAAVSMTEPSPINSPSNINTGAVPGQSSDVAL